MPMHGALSAVVDDDLSGEVVNVAEGKRHDRQLHDVKVEVERVDDRDYFRFDLRLGKSGLDEFRWAKLAVYEEGKPALSLPVQTKKDDRGIHIWFYMARTLAASSTFTMHFEKEPAHDNGPTTIYKVHLTSYLPREPQRPLSPPLQAQKVPVVEND